MNHSLIYFAIAIGLLYVVRALEYEGARRSQGGEFEKLRTAFEEENNFDLVIIGSSRAECQFYTPVIDSATGLSCYNLGMTGATMPLIASTLEAYLVHSAAPKYVVLNLDLHSLGDNNDTVYRFPRYFAFLDNEKLYEGLNERDGRFFFFKWLPFYSMPYYNNRYLSNSIHGWINTPTQFDSEYAGGFSPAIPDSTWGDLDTAATVVTDATVPEPVLEALLKIENICREHNCRLIYVVSPLFYRQEECVTSYDQVKNTFQSSSVTREIPFIDLGHDSIRFEQHMYADPAHLNKEGAVRFTRRFSSVLVQYLVK